MGEIHKEIDYLKKALTIYFKIINLRPVIHYSRVCITRDLAIDIMFFIQEIYIQKILERFGIQNAKRVNTLIAKKNIFIHVNPSYQVDLLTIT